jgi:glycerol kinase
MYPILAIDQGTTSTKAYRSDGPGHAEFVGGRTHRQIRPNPGWVEHDPLELLENIKTLIAAAGPVATIGLANQGETVVAWDARTKRPLHNAIVWQDERTGAATKALADAGHERATLARAGLPLDPYFSASKLRWLLDHADGAQDLLRAGRLRLGTSDAFFIDALTGAFATDVSTASRTSLADLKTLRWDETLCGLFGVPVSCLPEIRPTFGDFGRLAGGARLAASAVDQQAALFGHGARAPGDIKITFGTGAFALGLTGAAPVFGAGGLLPTVAWQIGDSAPDYALDGGIFTAGSALEWLRGVGLLDDFAALDQPGQVSAAAQKLFFVPAQAGLGCPYWDRSAAGAWIGIGLDTPRQALALAVIEGIALRAAQLAGAFAAVAPLGRISIDGGLSQNSYFARFLANAIGREIAVADHADLTAIGMLQLCTGAPAAVPATRLVVPDGTDFDPVRRRFADAVERTRGWNVPG